jgi:hypothetical protein
MEVKDWMKDPQQVAAYVDFIQAQWEREQQERKEMRQSWWAIPLTIVLGIAIMVAQMLPTAIVFWLFNW